MTILEIYQNYNFCFSNFYFLNESSHWLLKWIFNLWFLFNFVLLLSFFRLRQKFFTNVLDHIWVLISLVISIEDFTNKFIIIYLTLWISIKDSISAPKCSDLHSLGPSASLVLPGHIPIASHWSSSTLIPVLSIIFLQVYKEFFY